MGFDANNMHKSRHYAGAPMTYTYSSGDREFVYSEGRVMIKMEKLVMHLNALEVEAMVEFIAHARTLPTVSESVQ